MKRAFAATSNASIHGASTWIYSSRRHDRAPCRWYRVATRRRIGLGKGFWSDHFLLWAAKSTPATPSYARMQKCQGAARCASPVTPRQILHFHSPCDKLWRSWCASLASRAFTVLAKCVETTCSLRSHREDKGP